MGALALRASSDCLRTYGHSVWFAAIFFRRLWPGKCLPIAGFGLCHDASVLHLTSGFDPLCDIASQ
jgi:hypothetical protein